MERASPRGSETAAMPIVVPPDQPMYLVVEDAVVLSAAGDTEFLG